MPGGWAGCCVAAVLLVAVTLTSTHAQTPVVRFEVERFVVEGDNPLSEARTREVLAPFTGEHAGVDGLLAAADALERAIQEAGVPFQRVVLPPQPLHDGGSRAASDGVRAGACGGQRCVLPLRGERAAQRAGAARRGDAGHRCDRPEPGSRESPAVEDDESDVPGERSKHRRAGCDAGGRRTAVPGFCGAVWTIPATARVDHFAGRSGRAWATSSTVTTV